MANLTIQIMDVGQGDGIFVVFPDGTTMLVDYGSTKNKALVSDNNLKYFKAHTKFSAEGQLLDYLILTHGDIDHYNMVRSFCEGLKANVGTMLYGGQESDYNGLISGLNLSQKMRGGPPIKVLGDPKKYPSKLGSFGGADVWLLGMNVPAATRGDNPWRKNTNSVVLQIRYAGQKVMLTGDATIDTERAILALFAGAGELGELKSEVWKVQHHGSARTSVRPSWVQAVQPEFAFVSSDRAGTMSDTQKTHHRLPQELCLDLIRDNTTLFQGGLHPVVSSYDPTDYADYRNPDTAAKGYANKYAATKKVREWLGTATKEALFTTLAEMDKVFPDTTVADAGVQYQITIKANGEIGVMVTD